MRARRGVQPRVVALGLDPADAVPGHQVGDAAELGGDHVGVVVVAVRRLRRTAAASTRRTASSRRSCADRFEQVVDGADVERGDGLVVVRRHEHDGGPVREVGQHTGQLDAGQAGHVDVEEDRVDRCGG